MGRVWGACECSILGAAPDYRGDGGPNDVAHVRLDRALPVTPAQRLRSPVPRGALLTIVDAGMYGTNSSGPLSYDGKKRGGTNIVDGYGGDPFNGYAIFPSDWMMTEFDAPTLGHATDTETLILPGGSGGGAFYEIAGEVYLAGMPTYLTRGMLPAGAWYGNGNGITSFEPYNAWFDTKIVPEPASGFLMLALPLVFGRRIGR